MALASSSNRSATAPKLGPSLVASPYLLDMADAGSDAGVLAVSSLKPALEIFQREDFSAMRLGELLPVLANAAPDLELAGEALSRYSVAREESRNVFVVPSWIFRVRPCPNSLSSLPGHEP